MPIDPSIALGLQPSKPIDYLGAYGNALTLKNLMGQQELQGLQLQQARREADKQMRLSDLVRRAGGNMQVFEEGLMAEDPMAAIELGFKRRKSDAELAKFGAEGKKLALESAEKFSPIYLRAAQFVKSRGYTPESVAEAKQMMLSQGVPADLVAGVPDSVTPEYVEGVITSNMSFADRLAREQEERKRFEPQSPLGKQLRDWYLSEKTGGTFEPPRPFNAPPSDPNAEQGEAVNSNASRMDDLFSAAIRREALGPADQVMQYDPNTGRPVVVPEAFKAQEQLRRAGASNVQQFNNTKDNFKNERDLRNDFKSEPIYKAHSEVRSAYGQIGKSLGLKSPAGDLAAATKIMKLLDPGSVVRESELGMAVAATGLEDRLTNFVQNIISGNKLTPKQREDFRKLADELFLISEREYDRVRKEYMDTAKDYNLSPERVGGRTKPSAGVEDKPAPGGTKAQGSKTNPFRIKGDDGYNALPKGAFFIGPDGKLRQKP